MAVRLPSAEVFSASELPLRDLSAAEQVDHYAERRGAVDLASPGLGSIIELNPDAMDIAMQRDVEAGEGRSRGPLHGLAVAVKDNMDTADAMLTTAGSLAMTGGRPRQDAAVVARLRDAGMVVLGKSNLSEWANFRSPQSVSGWSGRGGLTRNPWDLTRSAGGSSSGSGAAVSAGVAPLALGTETDGSIICPASYCGVVGLKPSTTLLPTSGIVPISAVQDAPGPMAPSVRLTAALLDTLRGPGDSEYLAHVDDGVQELRVGVVRDHFGAHSPTDALIETALQQLAASGAVLVDSVPAVKFPDTFDADVDRALTCEFADGLTRYLATRTDGGPRSIAEIVAFNTEHADEELPWFGQQLLEDAAALMAQAGNPVETDDYRAMRARMGRQAREEGLDAIMGNDSLDALVSPAFPPAPLIDLVLGDYGDGGECTTAPAVAGYPILSVPVGHVRGLPVGLAITGRPGSESVLLRLARSVELSLGLLEDGALSPDL